MRKKPIIIVCLTIVALMLAGGGLLSGALPAIGDGGTSTFLDFDPAFYIPPADLSIYQPGDLIRSEIEPGMEQSILLGATAHRIMYRSEGALGQPIGAVAMVFIPAIETPADGWDIAVWAHGTTSTGDTCAPTMYSSLYHSQWVGYGKPVKAFLLDGYMAVAPDYEGLGTPGNHTWMASEATGQVIIDAVKAARQLGYETSGRFGVFGHSQGAFATRAVSVLATPETLGDMELVGTVEAGGAMTTSEDLDFLFPRLALSPQGGAVFLMYTEHAIRALNPDFDSANFLGPALLPLIEAAEAECWEEFNARFTPLDVGGDDYLNPGFASDPDYRAWAGMALDPMDDTAMNAPVLLFNVTKDAFFQVDDMYAVADNLCAAGAEVESIVLDGKSHDYMTYGGMPIVRQWLADRFAGEPVNTTCDE